ncbi:hypothetical protein KQY27_05205 [Methanobrevibacter sp. TMH8]|uniref:hypothetical protein n=1 Tax=Methanobrevibacter sp. TMH8 TaxID=2848611 RepID=UPI001CCD4875|nr:hypothetical protein [Methanobrevibacter sp. TMH8]MBZ9570938.1 hypothetical protein [Methanobrevibacter sp. TMH8]
MTRKNPYPSTDSAEKNAVDLFNEFLSNDLFKKQIKTEDKTPNHDGFFEIVDENRHTIATIFVQIKKHPNNENNKVIVPLSLYDYSSSNTNPILFISSDINQKIVYWVYIHDNLKNTKNISFKNVIYKSTTVFVNDEDFDKGIITRDNYKDLEFHDKWLKIFNDHLLKFRGYSKLLSDFNELKENIEPILGNSDPNFIHIHKFLDVLNNMLEKFKIVKHRFFGDSWKIGFMYHEFSKSHLSYALYPIEWDVNDVQIKKVKDFPSLAGKNFGFTIVNDDNKILKKEYYTYSIEVIRTRIKKIFNEKALIINNEFLANEFLFSFAFYKNDLLGISKKESYSTLEIRDSLIEYLNSKNRNKWDNDYPLNVLIDCLYFFENSNIQKIYMPYPQYDTYNARIYDMYGKSSLSKFLETFFGKLPIVYNNIFNQNFHNLNDANRFLKSNNIFTEVKIPKNPFEYPTINIFYCKSNGDKFNSEIFFSGDEQMPTFLKNKDFLKKEQDYFSYNGTDYRFIEYHHSGLDFVFEKTPIFSYIYSLLKSDFEKYFKEKIKQFEGT